jgi:hypothetical protein
MELQISKRKSAKNNRDEEQHENRDRERKQYE